MNETKNIYLQNKYGTYQMFYVIVEILPFEFCLEQVCLEKKTANFFIVFKKLDKEKFLKFQIIGCVIMVV